MAAPKGECRPAALYVSVARGARAMPAHDLAVSGALLLLKRTLLLLHTEGSCSLVAAMLVQQSVEHYAHSAALLLLPAIVCNAAYLRALLPQPAMQHVTHHPTAAGTATDQRTAADVRVRQRADVAPRVR